MTVYELIKELSKFDASQRVVFDVWNLSHKAVLDAGDEPIKLVGDVDITIPLDLHLLDVEDIYERGTSRRFNSDVHIVIC